MFSHKRAPRGLRSGLAVLIVPVVVAAGVLFGAAPANAQTVAVTYGYGRVWQDSAGFFGQLRDTTTPDGYCVEMQRKTSTQEWVTSGFWSTLGSVGGTEIHVVACSTTFVDWHIRNPGAVYGLRLKRYPSGPATTFCDGWEQCVNLT